MIVVDNKNSSEILTGSVSDYPCAYCGRKNCTKSLSSSCKCQDFISEVLYDNIMEIGGYESKIKGYIKRSHHKKKSYYRGKF